MKHRIAFAALGLAGLMSLGACSTSAVNQGISDANTACQTLVPAAETTAQNALKGGAANTGATVSNYANQACGGVAQAAANESAIDAAVSQLDSLWESVFGTNTPATAASPATATPATATPATAAPAATATPTS